MIVTSTRSMSIMTTMRMMKMTIRVTFAMMMMMIDIKTIAIMINDGYRAEKLLGVCTQDKNLNGNLTI